MLEEEVTKPLLEERPKLAGLKADAKGAWVLLPAAGPRVRGRYLGVLPWMSVQVRGMFPGRIAMRGAVGAGAMLLERERIQVPLEPMRAELFTASGSNRLTATVC